MSWEYNAVLLFVQKNSYLSDKPSFNFCNSLFKLRERIIGLLSVQKLIQRITKLTITEAVNQSVLYAMGLLK